MSPELAATIAVQVIGVGIMVGMMRQKQANHDEKFTEQSKRLDEFDRDKLDLSVYLATTTRLDGNISAVSHRVSGIDQRVYGIETGIVRPKPHQP